MSETFGEEKSGSYLYDSIGKKLYSLSHVQYTISIHDFVMHLESVQKYKNKSENPQELLYKFFVNKTSTIYNIEIEIFDPKLDSRKRLKAKIFKKEEAKEIYDDEIAAGNTAMLVEEEEGKKDIIELNLGNVGVGWEVTIWMKVVQELECEKSHKDLKSNTLKIMLPSMNYFKGGYEKTELEKNVSLDIRIRISQGFIKKIVSPSHENSFDIPNFEIKRPQEVHMKTKGLIALSTDFLLHVTFETRTTKLGVCLVEKDEKSDQYSATISLIPKFTTNDEEEGEDEEEVIMTEVIFCLDCSGSMSGSRMMNAKNALRKSILEMSKKKKVKTNIIKFGSDVTSLFSVPQELDEPKNKEAILDYIRRSSSDMGGTNIRDAIALALMGNVEKGYSRQIVLLSDGEDYSADEIIQFVKRKASTARIFCFGIGNNINPVFMNQLAYASNGRCIFINARDTGEDSIEEKVVEQLKFVLQKSITSVDVNFGENVKNARSVLRHIPPIYSFQKCSLYYFLDKIPENVVLTYYYSGTKKHTEIIDVVVIEQSSLNIPVLSAKRRVLEIEDFFLEEFKTNKEKVSEFKNEIVQLSITYQFLSPLTSFLLVSENEESVTEELEKKEFTQLIPKRPKPVFFDRTGAYPTRRSRGGGTCYSIDSEVLVKSSSVAASSSSSDENFHQHVLVNDVTTVEKKKISEIRTGDYVQSFDCKGDIVFSEVLEVHSPFEKTSEKVEVLKFIFENGKHLNVTYNHYLYTSESMIIEEDQMPLVVENYKMKLSGLVKVGEYLLFVNNDDDDSCNTSRFEQLKIEDIQTDFEHVLNPITENTRMIVNGFCTSVLTCDNMAENSIFFRFECPISVDNRKKDYMLFERKIHEEFEVLVKKLESRTANLNSESIPNLFKIFAMHKTILFETQRKLN